VLTRCLPRQDVINVLPSAEEVRKARLRVMNVVRAWRLPLSAAALSALEVCAAEVITNAWEHTRATSKVSVRWTGSLLRVEVSDTSRRLPHASCPDDGDEAGRGLLLLEALSHRWGAHPSPQGKITWFEITSDLAPDQRLATLVRQAGAVVRRTGNPAASTTGMPTASARRWRRTGGTPAPATAPRQGPAQPPIPTAAHRGNRVAA
jgi:hypothetical protein